MTDHETPRGAAERQRTCAACGGAFVPGEHTEVEVLLDGIVRYVAVHPGHSTYSPAREGAAAARLREFTQARQAEEERDRAA
ncbi:hypothetical protein [Amycolatopsis sp. SID8362]|uniref:hypothetical protein n=1 Tax=Amycolatopsis sp. SID8362 TaxID=2690346 RepID=UPI00137192D8|nr:hypothetical protein [Amycolatopsis sp. SID8362]NBH02744.1 hypothetical protein [Amycolatopsis sp. SID8362]NED39446.1 hypothetical protein [Amycolatopsis sp. SID8362]